MRELRARTLPYQTSPVQQGSTGRGREENVDDSKDSRVLRRRGGGAEGVGVGTKIPEITPIGSA